MEPMLRLFKSLDDFNTRPPFQITLIELKSLRAHEEVDMLHLMTLKREIKLDKTLKIAIAVAKGTNIVLDGHHRFTALKQLGCKRIPVVFIDYETSQIRVKSWRNDYRITKEMVMEAGSSGKKLPPKTSRHMIMHNSNLKHISAIEKRVNFPLKRLT